MHVQEAIICLSYFHVSISPVSFLVSSRPILERIKKDLTFPMLFDCVISCCFVHLHLALIFSAMFVGEKQLDENKPIRAQLKTPDGKRPSIFLRYKEQDPDRGHIKVYPGGLKWVIFCWLNIIFFSIFRCFCDCCDWLIFVLKHILDFDPLFVGWYKSR